MRTEKNFFDMDTKMRECSACGRVKHFSEFYFDKSRGKPQSMCKKCKIKNVLTYYNPAKARAKYREKAAQDA